ncbi:hypothetical protein ANCCAN_26331 [Ancylostoma caninum]|uniref:Uncharacterized protein n=1 Tax=Ancylostoma caninum TaxID=29170 RepID=A0A368F768_ANCCA|nr:hypothetical protein ANCCAN_26331 [Ancylostoma caninum]
MQAFRAVVLTRPILLTTLAFPSSNLPPRRPSQEQQLLLNSAQNMVDWCYYCVEETVQDFVPR